MRYLFIILITILIVGCARSEKIAGPSTQAKFKKSVAYRSLPSFTLGSDYRDRSVELPHNFKKLSFSLSIEPSDIPHDVKPIKISFVGKRYASLSKLFLADNVCNASYDHELIIFRPNGLLSYKQFDKPLKKITLSASLSFVHQLENRFKYFFEINNQKIEVDFEQRIRSLKFETSSGKTKIFEISLGA